MAKTRPRPDFIDRHIDTAKRVKKLETTIWGQGAEYALRTQHPDPIAEHLCAISSMAAGSFPLGQVGSFLMGEELRETNMNVLTALRVVREQLNINMWVGNKGATYPGVARGNYQIPTLNSSTGDFLGNDHFGKEPHRDIWTQYGEWLYSFRIPGRPEYKYLVWNGSTGFTTGKKRFDNWYDIRGGHFDGALFLDGGPTSNPVTLQPWPAGKIAGVGDAYWLGSGGTIDQYGIARGTADHLKPPPPPGGDPVLDYTSPHEEHAILPPPDSDIVGGTWMTVDNGFFDYSGITETYYIESANHFQQKSVYMLTDWLQSPYPPRRFDREVNNPTTGVEQLGGVTTGGPGKPFVQTDFATLQANYWAAVSANATLAAWYADKLQQAPAGEWLDTPAGQALASADQLRYGKRITYDHGWQPLTVNSPGIGRLWYLKRHNFVHLRGWVSFVNPGEGMLITTLPAEAHPPQEQMLPVAGLTRGLGIYISGDGGVALYGWSGTRMARLDGVAFAL